jgi:hypothetical protein
MFVATKLKQPAHLKKCRPKFAAAELTAEGGICFHSKDGQKGSIGQQFRTNGSSFPLPRIEMEGGICFHSWKYLSEPKYFRPSL